MHWLGPYEVKSVTNGGVVQLRDLSGAKLRGMINGSRLKLYKDSRPSTAAVKKKNRKRTKRKQNQRGHSAPEVERPHEFRNTNSMKDNGHIQRETSGKRKVDKSRMT
jgi:hypothetical protein